MGAKERLLFTIIMIEGYVVLACELLVIRQLLPYVGSGTEIIAIIISGVLLPLAVGYEVGGKAYARAYAKAKKHQKKCKSIRALLRRNVLVAVVILMFGLSTLMLEFFFWVLGEVNIHHRLLQTACYVLMFLVVPVFLLGQTVPLISNYFSRRRLSEITGKMLFFSTTGSFLGSVFSTIVLMSVIGVHNTVIVTLGLLCLLYVLLLGKNPWFELLVCASLLIGIYSFNSQEIMKRFNIVSDNAYNTVSVEHSPDGESTLFTINHSLSSIISKNPDKRFSYIRFIEVNFIDPFLTPDNPPLEILAIGAGGFTVGLDDKHNHYTFVDIDPALKDVAEKEFLEQKLGNNKQFVATSARAFVHRDTRQYDLIILDTYSNMMSVPMETTTREYLLEVKALLKPEGFLVANIIGNPAFDDVFTVRYDNTFSSVFPRHTRELVSGYKLRPAQDDHHNRWDDVNVLYIYRNNALANDDKIYTDDKNTYSLDRH